MTSIHKCTYVNVAEKPLEGNIYSNDYYAKNKYQTKLHPQKHEKKKKQFKKKQNRTIKTKHKATNEQQKTQFLCVFLLHCFQLLVKGHVLNP